MTVSFLLPFTLQALKRTPSRHREGGSGGDAEGLEIEVEAAAGILGPKASTVE